ncbi:MAG: 4-(cytidine 5'-diphospho)-2-C-methyl-D-erythritol kinase [Nocardioides sp.]
MQTHPSLTVRAPAKVNLHLGVGAPREDGFHPLDTVYQALGIYDDVTVAPSVGADADDFRVIFETADYVDGLALPAPGDNIVDRAAALLGGPDHPGADVRIRKGIPVAGGMAGGSADGAAALVGLDRLWSLETPDERLLALAAELGSDVPFELIGGTAHGTGRGELVQQVADPGTWWWVVVTSTEGLSTPAVYRRWDRLFPDASPEPLSGLAVLEAIASGNPLALARAMHNDLEAAAFDLRPDLERRVAHGESEGALRGMVTGSGPTCIFLCGSAEEAREVGGSLRATWRDAVLVTSGPVAGAHIVSNW